MLNTNVILESMLNLPIKQQNYVTTFCEMIIIQKSVLLIKYSISQDVYEFLKIISGVVYL